ncbi:MAG: carboxylesterase family protein [Chloroflexi bacterium]|nr:carboxylesterase family protein [Chloroflexota bacterium]
MKISSKLGILLLAILLATTSILAACSSDDEDTSTLPDTPTVTTSPTSTPTESPTVSSWAEDPIVQTIYGMVEGFVDEQNTWVWKAIPYANPPVDELRWEAPQNPEPWEGTLAETEFCQPCSQYNQISPDTMMGSEDCLYLNVWRPQTDETNLPVYVWIHGGGNSIGSATQDPATYGFTLANKSNMVFVSMNYRLGPLGWFTHPALRSGATGDEESDSGNFGTLDLIQSLKWIQDNIQAFGGDPNNVMITGESAGALNVLALMVSPPAENLFHRALAQSAPSVSVPVDDGEADAHRVLLNLLVNDETVADQTEAEAYLENISNAEIEAYLRTKTPDELFASYDQIGWGLLAFPTTFSDGAVITARGYDTFGTATHVNKVPLMVGSTKEETKIFLFMDPFFEGKDELYQTVATYSSDLWKANGTHDVARKLTGLDDQPDVYVYQFLWGAYKDDGQSPIPAPYDLKLGAAHSLDVPFFLGAETFNVMMTDWVFTEENRPGRLELSDAMMTYTAQFARTGNPNVPGSDLPQWEPWSNDEGEPKLILFDADENHADISVSTMELTLEGVMEAMKAQVPESLYSETLRYLLSFVMTSYMLEGMDIEPPATLPTIEPTPEPTKPPQSSEMPEIGTTWTHNVNYGDENTVWTVSITGGEAIDGVDCYITEASFDAPPERLLYTEMVGSDLALTITGESSWINREALQAIKNEVSTHLSSMSLSIDTTTTFAYDGAYGMPLSVGQTWSYQQESVPSMGPKMISTWNAEVVGMEEITVPAGTFNCYKVVHTSGDISRTEWWSVEGDLLTAVKLVNDGIWTGIETRELASYSAPE